MSDWLDGLLDGEYDFTIYSRKNARAELAQLRATIAELEATVEQAREVIAITHELSLLPRLRYETNKWLSAHPAAVSPENTVKPRSIIDAYADGM
jgi:hypothetical protein